jgi:hypothetical protein
VCAMVAAVILHLRPRTGECEKTTLSLALRASPTWHRSLLDVQPPSHLPSAAALRMRWQVSCFTPLTSMRRTRNEIVALLKKSERNLLRTQRIHRELQARRPTLGRRAEK